MIKLTDILNEDCWKDYKQVGMKKKNGKMVPNCVPEINPSKIKPACAMDENAKKRFMFCCLSANKLPVNMVASATT